MKRRLITIVIQELEEVLNSPDNTISETNRIKLRRAIDLLADEENSNIKQVLDNIRTAVNCIGWIRDIIDGLENDE